LNFISVRLRTNPALLGCRADRRPFSNSGCNSGSRKLPLVTRPPHIVPLEIVACRPAFTKRARITLPGCEGLGTALCVNIGSYPVPTLAEMTTPLLSRVRFGSRCYRRRDLRSSGSDAGSHESSTSAEPAADFSGPSQFATNRRRSTQSSKRRAVACRPSILGAATWLLLYSAAGDARLVA
jgi:hypothetical protein